MTTAKKVPGTPFTKGDPRINRKGRPKSFDTLRALTQQIANEIATANGEKIVNGDGYAVTNVEMILRQMMTQNPERFIEIGFGKVPQPVELEHKGKIEITPYDYNSAIRSVTDSDE
jgi:hypothetical protein